MSEIQQSQVQSKEQETKPSNRRQAAADTSAVLLTPTQIVEQLRLLRAQMPNVDPLTDLERKQAREQSRLGLSPEAVQASINAMGAADGLSQAVEMPAEDAQQFLDETGHWTAVEAELKRFLGGVADANLIRRKRTGILAAKVYGIAKEMARDNPEVRTHVKEIKRLRALARPRKKAGSAPQTPSPAPAAGTPSPNVSTEAK
jgi:hypothetical protein